MSQRYRLRVTDAAGGICLDRLVTGAWMRFDEHPAWRHAGFVDATPCFDVEPPLNTNPLRNSCLFSDGQGGQVIIDGLDSDVIGSGRFPYIAVVEPVS